MGGLAPSWGLHLPLTLPHCLTLPQLFNTFPWLGSLLGLHRPVLRKIEEVQTILQTLLEARRPPSPRGGPVKSYIDALLQQCQVRAGPGLPRKPMGGSKGSGSGQGTYVPSFPTRWGLSLLLCERGPGST